MITNEINEISIWLDQQEDEGLDVSSLRILCAYNYFTPFLVSLISYKACYEFGRTHTSFGNITEDATGFYGDGCPFYVSFYFGIGIGLLIDE